jgi:hypothetical protein
VSVGLRKNFSTPAPLRCNKNDAMQRVCVGWSNVGIRLLRAVCGYGRYAVPSVFHDMG